MNVKVKEWIDLMSRSGQVCRPYMQRISACTSREDLFRVLCDVNGGAWVFDMMSKGVSVPLDDFCAEFANFINGKRIMKYVNNYGSYSSKMYVRADEAVADTTICYILKCENISVEVPKFSFPKIILSPGTHAHIHIGDGARVNLEVYGGAMYTISGCTRKVKVKKY